MMWWSVATLTYGRTGGPVPLRPIHSRIAAVAIALLMLIPTLQGAVPLAHAVVTVAPTTTLSAGYTGDLNVTYTFSGYTAGNGENISGASVTFPAGTDVTAAAAVSPAGTVTVSGQTVTVTFTAQILRGEPIVVAIGGIVNPATAGTYNAGSITFFPMNPNNNQPRSPDPQPTGDYTLLSPVLTLSISPNVVDFDLSPGVASAAQYVSLAVTSSHPYTITRQIGGDATAFGLDVSGTAEGIKAAGTDSYTDSYVATAPWTTQGDAVYAATVTYTVVQN